MSMTDNRIIQMQFENREFEKNIAKSQKSVEDLKKAMDFDETSEGLKKFSRGMHALDFSTLGSNIQRLTDKFTGLGNIGEYVLSRLRASIEGAASSMERFIRSISLEQISVGQSKYDALNKSVQTIIAGGKYTEKEAYGVMERVMAYTDQTSHNFQTMVGQISALQSVGMELGEAERFLEGIGNASTKAGAGATEAAAAMSLMAKVVGGTHLGKQQFDSMNQTYRVVTQEWRQMALDAAVEAGTLELKNGTYKTAKQFGKQVEVTASTLENTLAKGWFTGEVAKKLYSKYQFGDTIDELQHPDKVTDPLKEFGKTAYLTGQRALTLADAMNAVRESVSSGWMETFRIALGDVTEAAEFFTNVCDRMIESLEPIKDFRNEVLKSWRTNGGHDSLLDILLGDYWKPEGIESEAVGFMDFLDGLGKIVYTGFRDFVLLFASPVDRMMSKKYPDYFKAWLGARLASITESVQKFMQKIRNFFTEEIDVGGKTKSRLEMIYDIVHGISGALALGLMIIDGIFILLGKIREALGPSFDEILLFFSDLGMAIFDTARKTQRSQQIKKFFTELGKALEPITNGINGIIVPLVNLIRTLLGLDKEGTNGVSTLQNIGEVIKAVVDIVSKAIGPILSFIGNVITLLDQLASGKLDFSGFLQGVGDAFSEMFSTYESYLPDWLKNLFGGAGDEAEKQEDNFFTRIVNYFKTNFATAGKALETVLGGFSLKSALESGFGFVSAFNFLGNIIGWFKGTNLYNVILAFLGVAALGTLWRLLAQAKKAVRTIGGFFDDVGGSLKAGVLGQYEWNSEKILNFAKGILMIAASIMLLGSMDPKALIAGVAAVGLIFAALMIFVSMVNGDKFKANYVQQFAATAVIDAIAVAIVGIVAALAVLMLAMAPLAAMGWQSVTATILGFVAVVATLGSFIVIMLKQMNKFMKEAFYGNRWGEIGKMAVMMLLLTVTVSAISLAVGALMIAMAPIAAIGWQGALTAAITLAAVMAAIGTFVMVMMNQMNQFMRNSFYSNGWGEIGKMAVMMILLAATVSILATGISVLIVAMAPLAAMSWQSVLAASAGVGIVLAVIGTFIMVMLNQMDNFVSAIGGGGTSWGGIAKMAAMMLALSLMVSLLSVGISAIIIAITPLAAMSAAGVAKAVIGLGVILFELGAFMKTLLSMADASGATVKLMGFTAFAFSIGLLVLALTPLALMDWAGWGRAMLGLAIVLGELIGAMKLMQTANVSTVALAGFAGFAASIGILIFALQPLAGMDWGGWGRAMLGLAIVLGELIGAMKLMDMLKVNTGTLFGFIGFAASIAILIYALKPLAEMDTEGYYRAIFGLGTVMLEVVVLMAIMNELKPDLKTAGSVLVLMIGLGAAMVLFGIAFNEVKDVPWQNIVAFGTAIALIVAALGVAAKGAKALSFKGILMLALGLAAILGVIALMAPLLIGSVASALTDMASSFTLISSLMESASANSNNVDEGGIDKMIRILGKMKDLFLGLVGFKLIKGSIDAFTEAVAALNLAAGQLQMLNQKLSGLSEDGGMGKLKKTAQSIKDLFTNELSDISSYEGKANSFSMVMYQLGTALGTFRDLTKDVGDPEESNAIKMIQTLADSGMGLDVLSKLSLTGLTSQIAALGGAMMLYAQGAEAVGTVEGYEEGKIDDQKVTAAVGLMQSIATSLNEAGGFTIPENMPGEEELGLFGSSLAALAGALIQLEQAGSSLGNGWENALNVFDFFQKLKARLAATEFFTNLEEFLFMGGESLKENKANELTVFGNNISQLAQSMGQFVTSTTYLDETTHEVKQYDYTNAISAMESIAEIPRKMPPLTGPTLLLIGRRISLTTFAEQIELLGSALKDFHTNTTTTDNGIPTEFTYTNAIKALESIAAIPGKMPVAPGWIPRLWQGNPPDLTQLSKDIIALGGGLKQFAKDLAGDDENPAFDPNTVQPAVDSLDPMITLMTQLKDKLPQVGGLAQILPTLWTGRDFTLDDLSNQIGKLGDGLGKLGAGINSGEWKEANGTKYAFEALDSVLGVMLKLEQMTGFTGSAYANLDKLTYFIEGLTGMNTYEDGLEHNPIADSLVDFMDKLNTAFVMLEDDDGYLNMTLDRFEMFKTFAEGLNQLTNSDLTVDWSFIGTKLTTDVAASITTGTDNVVTSFSGLLTAIQNAGVTPTVVTWESIGTAIDTGIVNGINGGTDGVTQAARNIAKAAYDAAMAQLDANSPSKVFTEVGSYIGLGMAQGIDRSAVNVVDAATGMSENAIATAGTLMAKISQVMAEGTDTNPTITPVLDLSQVEAGISELGGMGGNMSINTAYASGMAARAISSSGRDSYQNGTDLSGVYERMTQLSNQIAGMNKAISNMKLVLNTGVVAGGVTDDVDANIGRKAFYAYRNN